MAVVNVNVAAVAPLTFAKVEPPSVDCCHCTVGVGTPDAAAVNDADCPAGTVCETGFVVMAGAVVVPTIACEISHARASFAYVPCMANDPVAKVTSCAPPVPPVPIHAHLSAFS